MASDMGLRATEGQWSKALVHWFDAPMPDPIRVTAVAAPELKYFKTDPTPHNPATEGYIDPASQQAITFLVETK
jgi:hypothetical protein